MPQIGRIGFPAALTARVLSFAECDKHQTISRRASARLMPARRSWCGMS